MAHIELNLRERREIEDMLSAEMPVSKIAAAIGRHRSTIYREINRNYFEDTELPYLSGYYCINAQRTAEARRARRRKLIRLDGLREHVIDRLEEGWTPEQISGRLGYDGQSVRVSHETIYAYVYSKEGHEPPHLNWSTAMFRERRTDNGEYASEAGRDCLEVTAS